MAIRYKIVVKYGRISMFARGLYSLTYKKGNIVKALPGTLGVMVFKNRWQATRFMDTRRLTHPTYPFIIIRVKTFSRGVVPKKICSHISYFHINGFYNNLRIHYTKIPPMGTICYDKVEVID